MNRRPPLRLALGFAVAVLALGACSESPTSVQDPDPSPSSRRADLTLASVDPVLVGAGDMHADCVGTTEETTAALVDGIDGTVFTLGDNTESGTTNHFNNCYDPTWGRHKLRTQPAPGDNDYEVAGAAPYYAYFGASAGSAGQGYYSYTVGAWHIIALNSNIASSKTSAQYAWLQADLDSNPTACALAYWHHSRFSSTRQTPDSKMKPAIWQLLDAEGVDLVLGGHYHHYERFAPQNSQGNAAANGIREFVVGTGGKTLAASFTTPRPTSQVRYNGSFGVLKLTLHAASYDWEFVPEPGFPAVDAGTAACVQVPASTPPVADDGGPYTGNEGSAIDFNGSASFDPNGGALTYAWDFGDGTGASDSTPSHAYADDSLYTVQLIVTDPGGLSDTTETIATVSNVAPTATFNAPASVPPLTDYGLSLTSPTDPSSVDVTAGFTYAFDCGDGLGYGLWGSASSTSCTGAPTEGQRSVGGKIRDVDLGEREYTATVQISEPQPNQPPVSNPGGPYAGNEGTAINFSGTGSSDPESQALTYAWDFGDGTGTSGATPSHAYADDALYTVTLIVTDPGSLSDTTATSATVANVAPTATFNAPASVPPLTDYDLSLTSPTDPSSTDVTAGFEYAFDCGDGSSYGSWGSASSTSCTGTTVGQRSVGGKIRDVDLGEREYTDTVQISEPQPNQPPVSNPGGPYTGNEGTPINFSGTGSSDPESEALTYAWDFGDGTGASTVTPSHAYADNGIYTVQLIVTDPGSLSDTTETSATVANVKPTATFNAPTSVPVNTGFTLSLTNQFDPSSADTAAGFTYQYNCGSGLTSWLTASTRNCPGRSTAETITVIGKIRDKDTAITIYSRSVQITAQ